MKLGNLEEYFNSKMQELGFYGNDLEKVNGYYRTEATWNIIADYLSMKGEFLEEDVSFISSYEFSEDDFVDWTYKEIDVNGEKELIQIAQFHDGIKVRLFGGSYEITFDNTKYTEEEVIKDIISNYDNYRMEDFDAEYRAWCD